MLPRGIRWVEIKVSVAIVEIKIGVAIEVNVEWTLFDTATNVAGLHCATSYAMCRQLRGHRIIKFGLLKFFCHICFCGLLLLKLSRPTSSQSLKHCV